jgi:DNA-binding beta-propeller fold protein YncE
VSTRIRISLSLLASLVALAAAAVATARQPVAPRRFAQARLAVPRYRALGRGPAVRRMLAGPLAFGSALVGSAPVGPGPSALAVNPATHTIYVATGENANGGNRGGNTVSVIDARNCNARDVSKCKGPWPTITVGNEPAGVALDTRTGTVYVSNIDDGTVSVINGATCNALTTSGCSQTPATVPVGSAPTGLFFDSANHTVYVSNFGDGTLSMIDSATCNGTDPTGCLTTPPATVPVGGGPGDVDVNQHTHTVYAANLTGLSVVDANTCNASTQAGCGTVGQAPVPECTAFPGCGPFSAKVDVANDTIYESGGTTTVFVFDGRACNAANLARCAADTPGEVTPFPEPGFEASLWVAVDVPLHTVYVTYQKDDALILIDANVCNGSHLAACATLRPQEIHTGTDPESVALDKRTQTLYTANQVSSDVSVIDPTRCDAQTTGGCRAHAPEVPITGGPLAADPPVATAYVANDTNTVSMIDTSACNALHPTGCGHTPSTATVGSNPDAVAVNRATHTVYVADGGTGTSGTITVLDDRGCNAHIQATCATASTMHVPAGRPVGLAVNPRTDTIYVATITRDGGPNLISVFNGATCNATATRGCDQAPANAPTGPDGDGHSTEAVTLNPATNTIYATSNTVGGTQFLGHTVYMIDGTTCDAANTTGCANTPATISVGSDPVFADANPFAIAVDVATDTIYTANISNGEGPGTVSIINGAICNSQTTSGCDQTPAVAPAGFGTNDITVDQTTNHIYATNLEDTSITTIDGTTCNGAKVSGCDRSPTRPIVGDYPASIAVDARAGTAYVADIGGVSVIPLTR